MEQKHIHFIGICGVAMSALAIAFHKKGWRVTGSDAGFYPPISTHLKKTTIEFYPGWHPEKMSAHGDPDIVVVGNVASSSNPEWIYVQEKNLTYFSYPEIISKYFVKENSLVCAGTYGKTTNTTLLTWILKKAQLNPSYMFGGISLNMPQSAALSDGNWSILEGDEYKTARWDNGPKFRLYDPTHLLLSAVSWDHADVYPTEQSYFDTFVKLIHSIPDTGLIVACTDHKGVKKVIPHKQKDTKLITYGTDETADYRYFSVKQTTEHVSCIVEHQGQQYSLRMPVIGDHMAENMCGCFAMAHQIAIEPKIIQEAMITFAGIKRRLERRLTGNIVVIDDIAHSPEKAHSVLHTLNKLYMGNVYAVFEPNTGNRREQSISQYAHAFKDAYEVIIPRLTKVKKAKNKKNQAFYGKKLSEIITKSHDNVHYIPDDKELVKHLETKAKSGDVIAFLGSHGFRGMIEETIAAIEKKI